MKFFLDWKFKEIGFRVVQGSYGLRVDLLRSEMIECGDCSLQPMSIYKITILTTLTWLDISIPLIENLFSLSETVEDGSATVTLYGDCCCDEDYK